MLKPQFRIFCVVGIFGGLLDSNNPTMCALRTLKIISKNKTLLPRPMSAYKYFYCKSTIPMQGLKLGLNLEKCLASSIPHGLL